MRFPEFTADGGLPPGIYRGTADEIAERFCRSSERRQYLEEPLRLLVKIAIDSEAIALFVNGSFVTDKQNPRDIDGVIVLPDAFDTTGELARRLGQLHRDYGLDIERVAAHDIEERDYLLKDFFGTDRDGKPRGLVEVIL
jgi:predicted nucleotidyltransferase